MVEDDAINSGLGWGSAKITSRESEKVEIKTAFILYKAIGENAIQVINT